MVLKLGVITYFDPGFCDLVTIWWCSNRHFQKANTSDKLKDFLLCEVLPINVSLPFISTVLKLNSKLW